MSVEILALTTRLFEEVWNNKRGALIDEMLSPESVCHADNDIVRGISEFRERMYVPLTSAFPDLKVIVEDMLADDNKVAVRWTARATHTGDGLGFPATGKAVVLRGTTWMTAVDGKLMEGWQSSNLPEVIRSLRGE